MITNSRPHLLGPFVFNCIRELGSIVYERKCIEVEESKVIGALHPSRNDSMWSLFDTGIWAIRREEEKVYTGGGGSVEVAAYAFRFAMQINGIFRED